MPDCTRLDTQVSPKPDCDMPNPNPDDERTWKPRPPSAFEREQHAGERCMGEHARLTRRPLLEPDEA